MSNLILSPRSLALALLLALAVSAAGCGDNRDCVGQQCNQQAVEQCDVPGDEDGDGLADCADPDCDTAPECQPMCGNGDVEQGEACDDGNQVDTDACTNVCEAARCGDGIVEAGVEECDDMNMVNTDACTNACKHAVCGDGIVGPGEECDDGNQVDTDACTNACTNAVCGDGIVGPGEACDDGNMVNTDGCTNACALPTCGDGIMQAGEACDDGNQSNTDACLNTCMNATCGDGFVRAGMEQCDDGNMANTDACLNTCANASCGDGFVHMGVEQCDDGNMVNDDACTNACTMPGCGDGVLQPGEQCDDGNMVDTDACTNACMDARCGDGIVHMGVEQCDDGNLNETDGCTSTCMTGLVTLAPHLLLTEVKTTGGDEFVEIYNPTALPVDLSNYYLSDVNNYFLVPAVAAGMAQPTLDVTDFLQRFPAGSTILPHGVVVVASDAVMFQSVYGVPPNYTLEELGNSVAMVKVWNPTGTPNVGLTNAGEMVALFYWDGVSDNVKDVDLVNAGNAPSAANTFIAKTATDGPDADAIATPYAVDMPNPVFDMETDTSGTATSYKRIAFEGANESHAGTGNGITGDDEMSEAVRMTWDSQAMAANYTAPTPGTVPASLQ
ncbi:MAG TPA: DUF4215 domain-containing protein [Kofleriaceae bacterium]|nr:DUF4215 domain-containing protein [Kofleriaceae bacterium]